MKLYAFGHNNYHEPDARTTSSTTSDQASPICILEAETIRILWTSWCDTIIAYQTSAGIWIIQYRGAGVAPELQEYIAHSVPIQEAVSGHRGTLHFFGSTLHDGLRGYLIKYSDSTDSEISIFSTDLEVEAGTPLVRSYSSKMVQDMSTVQMDSSGRIMIGLDSPSNEKATQIVHFARLNELAAHLDTHSAASGPSTIQHAPFIPTQWCTNATTSTALSSSGEVFTSSRDLRFSKCLGRAPVNAYELQPIPYFSETSVEAISSGGYMSGAISTDGELFLWGQSVPGHEGSISVLEDLMFESDDVRTGVSCAPEQDEIIKCLDVYIDGMEARTQRLAVGHGHVLIAAEAHVIDGNMKRAVLGAGVNSNGQTGLRTSTRFIKNFEEIIAFRDMAIQQLIATGWSTFVITL
ncbi:hypothetical protein DE146DRAFT_521079 [Phaeosphaeria sp. MPI-PUGE-AT-0046c]|nr:hypothetical protein DE146DRAFT_521079 [Phaeosphaeria sp. MPI-PUGE-AT-0046c]